jgi:hypothetical protein
VVDEGWYIPLHASLGGTYAKPQINGANRRSSHPSDAYSISNRMFRFDVLSDLAFWKTSSDFWASASLWLLGIGLIMAALAAVMGLTDVLGDDQIPQSDGRVAARRR